MEENLKRLLLIDLCARLPYGVIVDNPNPAGGAWDEVINIDASAKTVTLLYNGRVFSIDEIKPYLRSMSSMTKKEKEEFNNLPIYHSEYLKVDFYNLHHLDYRGLIPMGLALEAPEGMYKTE